MNNNILSYLAKNGPSSSSELSEKLGVSQPTISRLISVNSSIIKVGGSKNTIYGSLRDIRQLADSSIPAANYPCALATCAHQCMNKDRKATQNSVVWSSALVCVKSFGRLRVAAPCGTMG